MKKIRAAGIFAIIIFALCLFSASAIQAASRSADRDAALSKKQTAFNMGGINMRLYQPQGYAEASGALRQAAAQIFTPQENIFGVYIPANDKKAVTGSGPKLLHNRCFYVASALPEFMKTSLDAPFYAAMQRDIARDNGSFSHTRIGQFRVLAGNLYARDDAFAHKLGVYDTRKNSISIVHISRQAQTRGSGAISACERARGGSADEDGRTLVLKGWDAEYFSQAYHQVIIQNVMFMNGRCFNLYFFAPLAEEEDIYAAMHENRQYIDALEKAAGVAAGR